MMYGIEIEVSLYKILLLFRKFLKIVDVLEKEVVLKYRLKVGYCLIKVQFKEILLVVL